MGIHRLKIDSQSQMTYWLASKREMVNGTTWVTSTDASRFSRREWLAGPICNVDTQRYAWLQPMALHICPYECKNVNK